MKESTKRILVLSLCFGMILTMAACGGASSSTSTPAASAAPASSAASEASSAGGDVVVLKAAHSVSTTHPYHLGLEYYKKEVEEKTNGKVKIDIYDSGVLGDERACIEGLQMGSIDIAVSSTGPVGNFVSDFLVLDLPYLFPDADTARAVLDGDVGNGLLKQLSSLGITGAAFWENGFRELTNSKHPVNSVDDMKGLKLRTMENEIHMAAFKLLGADPTPMTWSDVYPSLQQGVIDGQENPIAIIQSQGIYEVNKYLAITNHVYSPSCLLISNITLQKLDQATQDILISCAKDAAQYERKLLTDSDNDNIAKLKQEGMEITYPDTAKFAEVVQPVYDQYKSKFSDGLLESVMAGISSASSASSSSK